MLRRLIALLAVGYVFSLTAVSPVAAQDGFPGDKTRDQWTNDVVVYLWAVDMDSDLTVGRVQVPVDVSFGDLWSILKFAAAAHYEGHKGDWGLLLDGAYTNLGEDGITLIEGPGGPVPTLLAADYRFKVYRGEAAGVLSPFDLGSQRVDFLGGIRYTRQDLTIEPGTPLPIELEDRGFDESWLDPFFGMRWGIGFGKYNRWMFRARADVGGFGIGSDFTFNGAAHLGYRFSRLIFVSLGYRYLYTDYESGTVNTSDYFAYKGDEMGLLLGLGFRF